MNLNLIYPISQDGLTTSSIPEVKALYPTLILTKSTPEFIATMWVPTINLKLDNQDTDVFKSPIITDTIDILNFTLDETSITINGDLADPSQFNYDAATGKLEIYLTDLQPSTSSGIRYNMGQIISINPITDSSTTATATGIYDNIKISFLSNILDMKIVKGLQILKQTDKTTWTEGNLTFIISVTNNGIYPFENLAITDTLDSQFLLIENTIKYDGVPVAADHYTYDSTLQRLTVYVDVIDPSKKGSVTFEVKSP